MNRGRKQLTYSSYRFQRWVLRNDSWCFLQRFIEQKLQENTNIILPLDLKKHLKRLHKLMDGYISSNWIYQMTGMGAHCFYKKVRYYPKSRSGMMAKCTNEVKLDQILLEYTVWKIQILTLLLLTFVCLYVDVICKQKIGQI